jgi:hypothetical protein
VLRVHVVAPGKQRNSAQGEADTAGPQDVRAAAGVAGSEGAGGGGGALEGEAAGVNRFGVILELNPLQNCLKLFLMSDSVK